MPNGENPEADEYGDLEPMLRACEAEEFKLTAAKSR
jgi:hypothetical protein